LVFIDLNITASRNKREICEYASDIRTWSIAIWQIILMRSLILRLTVRLLAKSY